MCPHAWHVNYSWQGTNYRFSLNKHLGKKRDELSKSEADRVAEHIRTAIRSGTFNVQPQAHESKPTHQPMSFGDFSETWYYLREGHRWVLTFSNGKLNKIQAF